MNKDKYDWLNGLTAAGATTPAEAQPKRARNDTA